MEIIITEELKRNYKQALKQKYNAVCLDIDGTLTIENSKNIDNRIIEIIAKLLKDKIPVLFITGRGETGLKDMIKEIEPILRNKYCLDNSSLSRMYALLNDGARLFKTTSESDVLFNQREYLASLEAIESLNEFNKEILEYFDKTRMKKYCDITYSFDSLDNKIINMRFNLKTNKEIIVNKIYNIIEELINDYPELTITKGIYEGKIKIQIGTTTKDYAIKKAEKIIGVPKNSMIRLGDCGDVSGNDFAMLNCPQGFSVKEISGNVNACFPIMDKNYNILTGIEATLFLLKNAKILPTICLESVEEPLYRKNYALVEKMINFGRQKYLQKYNKMFNEVFNVYMGIDDIFDKFSGSVIIPMYEWELIEADSYLKKFFEKNIDSNFSYILRDNQNIMLRGSSTYYYFLANRMNFYDNEVDKEIDFTSKNNVLSWMDNYRDFFSESINAIEKTENLNTTINKKLILGILDNVRNVLLILINEELNNRYPFDSSVIINLEKITEKSELKLLYTNLLNVHKMLISICSDKNYIIDKLELKANINEIRNLLEYKKNNFLEYASEEKDYSKLFRTYREIDNFAENLITLDLISEKNDNQIYGMCGLSYGGIELPIIYKAINNEADNILLLKFSKKISSYKNKHSIEIRNFDIYDYGRVIKIGFEPDKKYVIADDNLLTAKTMQLAINTFYDLNARVNGILVVRYPSINRVNQMFLENHGAVDYNYFFDYINGLCFPSPYSFRDEHIGNQYLDSLGIFDINRRKILECLYKNHDYDLKSEVARLNSYVKNK